MAKGSEGMLRFIAVLCLCVAASHVHAAENPRQKKEMQAIRAVIEENFRTSNNEDFSGVMATMTPYMPNREPFEAELTQFFEDTDVYTRLVDVSFISAEMMDCGPAATVRVIQQTTARADQDIPYSEFRTRSAMLPPWEVCEFDLVLHKIRGKWLVHKITGDVRESQLPEKPAVKESRPKR
jgi:hypothetical protein